MAGVPVREPERRCPGKLLFTPDNQRRDLLDAYPELAGLCDRIGFGDGMSLGEWSASPAWALLEFARVAFPPPPTLSWDLSAAEPTEVVADLLDGHHRPLRNEVQRIGILVESWARRDRAPSRVDALAEYHHFAQQLIAHLDHEEAVVFPRCLLADQLSRLPRGSVVQIPEATLAIRAMDTGHEEMEQALQRIRKRFEFTMRDRVDRDVPAIRVGLAEMAADLVVHETKESDVLIPAAIHAEDQAHARHGFR